jgi:hypothetical protein
MKFGDKGGSEDPADGDEGEVVVVPALECGLKVALVGVVGFFFTS